MSLSLSMAAFALAADVIALDDLDLDTRSLHAAFGFLEWTEPGSTESAFAPLVLLPVEIERIKTREGTEFWVKASGEDAETNLVLAEKMRLEFGIDVPKFHRKVCYLCSQRVLDILYIPQ